MKFIKKFAARMLIEAGAAAVIANILLQMTFDRIEIRHEGSAVAAFYILPIMTGLFIAVFSVLMAKHNTNVLRRYEYSLKEGYETAFYTVFTVVMILLCAADAAFLLYKCLPFLDGALSYAIKDAHIKNETPQMLKQILDDIDRQYKLCRFSAKLSAGLTFVLQAAVYILSAPRLIAEYRDPPDYWSGRKKGTDTKKGKKKCLKQK
ncbi:MAG: hypothetical protein ACI4JW_11910 [Oscillospiraceae bacterium]